MAGRLSVYDAVVAVFGGGGNIYYCEPAWFSLAQTSWNKGQDRAMDGELGIKAQQLGISTSVHLADVIHGVLVRSMMEHWGANMDWTRTPIPCQIPQCPFPETAKHLTSELPRLVQAGNSMRPLVLNSKSSELLVRCLSLQPPNPRRHFSDFI